MNDVACTWRRSGRLARHVAIATIVAAAATTTFGCRAPRPPAPAADAPLRVRAAYALGILPPAAPATRISELGRRLFFETRLSADGMVGCVTCHEPALWGADGLARSSGALGRVHERNSPTILDAAAQVAQHWRGDRTTVEDQAEQSLFGPASFGLPSADEAARRLAAIPGLSDAFRSAFGDDDEPVSAEHFGVAVGAYVRTLRAPSPFDAFLAGDDGALSASARRGLAQFIDLGCAGCHDGPLAGGTSFRKFGVFESYPNATGSSPVDVGRQAITGAKSDHHVFKVPPLRHVARTGPYFHDGSILDLSEAVRIMARVQLGEALTTDQVADLVAFLESLTGAVPDTFR